MNWTSENDFFPEGEFFFVVDGWRIEKEHFKLICDLARDQGKDPYDYLESLMKWMRERGCVPLE